MKGPALADDVARASRVNHGAFPGGDGFRGLELVDVSLTEGVARVRTEMVVGDLSTEVERVPGPLARFLRVASIAVDLGHHGRHVPRSSGSSSPRDVRTSSRV